ncbi:MAG: acyl-CoA reductase-like NAD-dependent aldehyde dehydrogenase [Myxococcota bacterium]|jgi:acyl-CoA reductase-like NAD-dependent aldehyde dehydrogenase
MSRLIVAKTLKMYAGGKFIRSESGRVTPLRDKDGTVTNVCRTSRKDLRNTLEIARAAQPPWAARTAFNRGQILYRLAEMIDSRLSSFPTPPKDATAAADRAVHHAGWSDKISAVLSTLNPVAGTFINYSHVRPMGVILAFPDPADGLLGMIEALCAATVMGNAVIIALPTEQAHLATALAEGIATCDMPGGVVNILTGDIDEIVSYTVLFDDLDCIYRAADALNHEQTTKLQQEGARILQRMVHAPAAKTPADPLILQGLAEVQTVWMSAYEPQGGAAAY